MSMFFDVDVDDDVYVDVGTDFNVDDDVKMMMTAWQPYDGRKLNRTVNADTVSPRESKLTMRRNT